MTAEPTPAQRAGIYVRISRDLSGEGLGVERQQEDCRALAATLGWEVVEVYIDNDLSATSGKPRPAYRQMLADLEAGTITAIMAWHPDRLYRRAVDLAELVEAVQRNRTPVATAKAGDVDLNTPTGLLVAELLGAIAMYEVRHKSERWLRSWQQKREKGVVVRSGNRMFGYSEDGAEVVDHEAAIARVMAAKIRQGDSILGVARWLDKQGVRTTLGKAWSPQGIKRYLMNPRIAGWATLNDEIVAEGQWEPVLDRETFETVRAMLAARTRAYVPRKSLLLGLLFCGGCGYRMITSGQKGKRTYRCPSRPNMPGCGRISGNAEPIEEYVEGWVERRLDDDRVRDALARLRSHPGEALTEATALELRVIELEAQLDEPGVPVEAIVRAIGRTKERLGELDLTLAAPSAVALLPLKGHDWPEDLQRRRRLVDLLVQRVVLKPADPHWPSARGFNTARVEITARQ